MIIRWIQVVIIIVVGDEIDGDIGVIIGCCLFNKFNVRFLVFAKLYFFVEVFSIRFITVVIDMIKYLDCWRGNFV